MTRAGFQQIRLRQQSLEAPGIRPLPAVSQSAGVADQLRSILAQAGQAVAVAGSLNARQQRAEDEQNIGLAQLQYNKDSAIFSDEIARQVEENIRAGNPLGDDDLRNLAESYVARGLESSGFNEAGQDYYRSRLTGVLLTQAANARSVSANATKIEALNDAALGFVDGNYDRTVAALREIDPNLSDSAIRGQVVRALDALAQTGDPDGKFEGLASKIEDGPELRTARFRLSQTRQTLDNQADAAVIDATEEEVYASLGSRDYGAARVAIESSAAPPKVKDRLRQVVESRIAAEENEARSAALDSLRNRLYSTRVSGDSKGFQSAVQNAIDTGLVQEADREAFNAQWSGYLTEKMRKDSEVALNDMRNAETPEDRAKAYQLLTDTLDAAESGLRADPSEFGSLTETQYNAIVGESRQVIGAMQDEEFKQYHLLDLLNESETGAGATFLDLDLPGSGDGWSAKEQAEQITAAKWQMTLAEFPDDSTSQIRVMTEWMARNPETVNPEWKRQYQGIVGRLFNAATQPDNPELLAGVKEDLRQIAVLSQANPEVAARHVPDNGAEMLEFFLTLSDTVLDDDTALRAALRAAADPTRRGKFYSLSEPDRTLIDNKLKAAGFGPNLANYRDIQRDAYARATSLATIFPGSMDTIAKRVAGTFKTNYQTSNNYAVKTGASGIGVGLDYGFVSDIVKKVHGADRSAVLRPNEVGQWMLYDSAESAIPLADSPVLETADLKRIMLARKNAAIQISARNANELTQLERARKLLGSESDSTAQLSLIAEDTVLGPLADVASVASEAISRMYQGGIMKSRRKAWTNRFLEQFKSDNELDRYQEAAVETLREYVNPDRSDDFYGGAGGFIQ